MTIISELEFSKRIIQLLKDERFKHFTAVTGPGRSGAVAAVYASYILGIPFIPFGNNVPETINLLIIDTVQSSGRTLRKASRKYDSMNVPNQTAYVIQEPPRVHFWIENPSAQT